MDTRTESGHVTRTQAASAAIARELEARRMVIDGSDDLTQLTVTVKFVMGSSQVRRVVYQDEQDRRREARERASVRVAV